MPKTKQQWEQEWDKTKGTDVQRAIVLLKKYSGAGDHIKGVGAAKLWRGITFQKKTYGDEVVAVLNDGWGTSGTKVNGRGTVDDLIKEIAAAINASNKQHNKTYNPNGDLDKIIQVITEKSSKNQMHLKFEDLLKTPEPQRIKPK